MGLAMIRKPQDREIVTVSGIMSETFRRYIWQISDIISGVLAFSPRLNNYADLADLNARFLNPNKNNIAVVDGQGLAFYDGSVWRKADNTLVV